MWKEAPATIQQYFLARQAARLARADQFDNLICLGSLKGVEHYAYQVETVRKVMRSFRGRVLLADEVGLGKTIEAGMILKEYLMRGMVKKALILTPPALTSQWIEELRAKFQIEAVSTDQPGDAAGSGIVLAGKRFDRRLAGAGPKSAAPAPAFRNRFRHGDCG